MRILADLMDRDVQMMRILSKLVQERGCSPKKRHLLVEFRAQHGYRNAEADNTFRKLALLEVVHHCRNGHCWLTDKGNQALQGATVRGAATLAQK